MYLKKYLLFLLTTLLSTTAIEAQLNFKVGYSFGNAAMSDVNRVHQAYNASQPGIVEPLKDLRWMHGIEIGVRQKWESLGIELSYQNLGRERTGLGLDANDNGFEKTLSYSTRSFSFAIENYFGYLGYGASIGRTSLRLKSEIPNLNNTDRLLTSDGNLSSQFYILLSAPGTKTVSLTIKPYISVNWGGFNLNALEPELEVDTGIDLSDINPTFFGISVLFYNGPQDY